MRGARVRMRLIALAVGVVLVVGSVVAVVRTMSQSRAYSGVGGSLALALLGKPRMPWFSEVRPGVVFMAGRSGYSGDVAAARADLDLLERAIAGVKGAKSGYESVWLAVIRVKSGVWGPTALGESIHVGLTRKNMLRDSGLRSQSPAEQEAQVRLIREHIDMESALKTPLLWMDQSLLTTGRTERSRVLWSGYAINAATIVGLGLIGWGTVGAFVVVRARRRIGKHQCAKCRYDLRGLVEARCPECGTPLPVACGDHPPPCGEREAEPEFGTEPAG